MAWLARILNVFPRTRLDRDIDAELAFHVEMRAREYEGQGMTAAAARQKAYRRLGNPLALRDRTRDDDLAVRLETAWLDSKYGLRMLARTPSFAVPAVLTLALGIGANTAMFALLYGILLRPLPYHAPDSVVIRSTAAADTVIATARQQMRAMDPTLPVVTPRPMTDMVSDAVGQPRFRTFLLATFAALALALAWSGCLA
jgi:hypothetical protein